MGIWGSLPFYAPQAWATSEGRSAHTLREGKKKKSSERGYGTPGSSAITDRRTNEACGRLTSQIGRDMVHSAKYGRTRCSAFVWLAFRRRTMPATAAITKKALPRQRRK
ncbi:hypothetical protein LSM04_009245 [Trypanosoma melophagium]|nr:hypothetical protein LSM04_009245 [Trypanosoma melophagium]